MVERIVADTSALISLENNFKKTVLSVFIVRLLCNLNVISDNDGWKIINKMCEKRTWGMNIIYMTAKKLWKGQNK